MSNSPNSFMPLWIADYLGDTMHLTCEQHGAYLLLLFAYWRRQAPLPADDATLAAIAKLSPQKWKTAKKVLSAFFFEAEGVWRNNRADQEISKASLLHSKKVAAGKKGAEIRYSRSSSAIAEPIADGKQPHSISHLTSHLDSSEKVVLVDSDLVREENREPMQRTVSKPASSKATRGRRWGADETVPADWIADGAELRAAHGLAPVDLKLAASEFENYWASASGKYAVKVDWRRAWLGRVTSLKSNGANSNGRSNGTGQPGHGSEVANVFVERYLAARAQREASRQ